MQYTIKNKLKIKSGITKLIISISGQHFSGYIYSRLRSENQKMSFSREVSASFLDFTHQLNKGHDVVAAIYKLMYNCKKENPSLFDGYRARLERAFKSCSTTNDLIKLLKIAYENIAPQPAIHRTKRHKQCLALVFFVAEWIWSRLKCNAHEVEDLTSAVLDIMERILCEKLGMNVREEWYTLVVSENVDFDLTKSESEFTSFVTGALVAWILTKIF